MRIVIAASILMLCGCAQRSTAPSNAPEGMPTPAGGAANIGGPAVEAFTQVVIKDTRLMKNDPTVFGRSPRDERAVKQILPPHDNPDTLARMGAAPAGDIEPLSMLDTPLTMTSALTPGPSQTEWRPPDPNIAVGPNHIVATVNMAFGIYDKATGALQYANSLNNYGDPGLFENEGSAWFVFDPRCFYDHLSQRFVILGLETYSSPFGSWVNIAVSDDSDPHGVWYTYRTPANTGGAWWDYPGFGYDDKAWVVTSNLIGASGSGIRVFDKQPMLSGGAARFLTLTSPDTTLQVAQHLGAARAANAPMYLAATGTPTELLVLALQNALTTPTLARFSLAVPAEQSPTVIPTPTDTIGNLVDRRMQTVAWRDGMLVCTKTVGAADGSRARVLEVLTNDWPGASTPTLQLAAGLGLGNNVHAFFPAASINADGSIGVVMNLSSATMNPSVGITARRTQSPSTLYGAVQIVKTGEVGEGGRWGDYSGIAVDPVDDRTFWGIAEYKTADGWANWITSFTVPTTAAPIARSDQLGVLVTSEARIVDVLANDITLGEAATITNFSSTSELGGTVQAITINARPGLRYIAPTSTGQRRATDRFSYSLQTASGTSTTEVTADVFDAALFVPSVSPPSSTITGLLANSYILADATTFPSFELLRPVSQTVQAAALRTDWDINAVAGIALDNVGLVYRGTFLAPVTGLYKFSVTANEGAKLFVGSHLVVDNSGPNSSALEKQNFIGLSAGAHDVRVEYYERWERAALTIAFSSGTTTGTLGGSNCRAAIVCDSIDFNRNGLYPEDADLVDFLSVLAGGACSTSDCSDIDFNNDGLFPSDDDLLSILRVLAGGSC